MLETLKAFLARLNETHPHYDDVTACATDSYDVISADKALKARYDFCMRNLTSEQKAYIKLEVSRIFSNGKFVSDYNSDERVITALSCAMKRYKWRLA